MEHIYSSIRACHDISVDFLSDSKYVCITAPTSPRTILSFLYTSPTWHCLESARRMEFEITLGYEDKRLTLEKLYHFDKFMDPSTLYIP